MNAHLERIGAIMRGGAPLVASELAALAEERAGSAPRDPDAT